MPAVHLQNEVGVPPDNNDPYGYRCLLAWGFAGPLTNRDKGKAVVNFLSVGLQTEDQIECYRKIEDYGAAKASDKPCQSRTGEHKKSLRTLPPLLTGVTKLVSLGHGHFQFLTTLGDKGYRIFLETLFTLLYLYV